VGKFYEVTSYTIADLMGKKYIGRLSIDWNLKKVTKGNHETFLSANPIDWHKKASSWLPKAFFTRCPFKPLVESSSLRVASPERSAGGSKLTKSPL
jgi:hypothetical protein